MNTPQLDYFIEIAKQKNMNKAAEIVHVSQSSLSQYLSRLESELGSQLFYRMKGNLTLTPAGQIYYSYAVRIRNLEQEMIQRIGQISGVSRIRVGVNSIWGNALMAAITPRFHERYPDSKLELFDENHLNLKKYLQEGSIDIALLATDSLQGIAGYRKILRHEEIVFAICKDNPALGKVPGNTSTLDIQDLISFFGKEPFILNKINSSFRSKVDHMLAESGFHPNVVCEISNMTTLRNMIGHNIAVSFMPRSAAEEGSGIQYFSITPPISRLNAIACRENLGFTEEVKHFIQLVEDNLPSLKPVSGIAKEES